MMQDILTLRIQELRQESNIYSLQVRWFSRIKDVKDMLNKLLNIAPSRQDIFQTNSSIPLSSNLTMHDLGIDKSGHKLRLSVTKSNVIGKNSFVLNHACENLTKDEDCLQLLQDVTNGLQRQQVPAKTDVLDCTGGVYFARGTTGTKIAVIKPNDEEQGMPNNPKGYAGSGDVALRPNFTPGFGCMREVASYVMDVDNFCRVPPTILVHFQHSIMNYPSRAGGKGDLYPKLGSLQKFVHGGDSFEDIGSSVLSDFEVQKIAMLDIRLLNCDRNPSNILAIHKDSYGLRSRGCSDFGTPSDSDDPFPDTQEIDFRYDEMVDKRSDLYELIPIDHGYCFPSKLHIDEVDWAWFYYPQVNRPVHEDIKAYIKKLDIEEIIKRIQESVSISEESLFLIRLSHQLLVEGIAAGLNLFEIASLIARTEEGRASSLERAIEEAEENAHRTIEMRGGTPNRNAESVYSMNNGDNESSTTANKENRVGNDSLYARRKRTNDLSTLHVASNLVSKQLYNKTIMSPIRKAIRTASSSADFTSDYRDGSTDSEKSYQRSLCSQFSSLIESDDHGSSSRSSPEVDSFSTFVVEDLRFPFMPFSGQPLKSIQSLDAEGSGTNQKLDLSSEMQTDNINKNNIPFPVRDELKGIQIGKQSSAVNEENSAYALPRYQGRSGHERGQFRRTSRRR